MGSHTNSTMGGYHGGPVSFKRTFALALLLCSSIVNAQNKWYKFSKAFIRQHYNSTDLSAIGSVQASQAHPAHTIHSVSCGGNDGELHIGIPGNGLVWTNSTGEPISGLAGQTPSDFGMVA